MELDKYQYGTTQAANILAVEPLRARLERRKREAEKQLDDLNKALKFLDENKDFEVFHDLLGKTGF